jgi:hypothetical protein
MKMFEGHKIPGIRRLRKKEVQELSKLPWVLDKARSDESHEARVLPDGRVLHYYRFDGGALLYPSRDAFEQAFRYWEELAAEAKKGPFDPAKELLPPLDEFIRDVDVYAKGLGKVLRIPDEKLDRSVESLNLVDEAVGHLRVAKRMTPEVFTPLTAYLGEVMRLVCNGRWGKLPATIKKRYPVYDPDEHAVWAKAQDTVIRAAGAAGEKAAADVSARGGGDRAQGRAMDEARRAVVSAGAASMPPSPTLLRWEAYEERIDGHEHEPVIWAHDGASIQPVAALVRTLSERSTYGTLRTAVEGGLARYLTNGSNVDRQMRAHRIGSGTIVPVKTVRQLSQLAWVRDEALSDSISEARLLPDGRVLVFVGEAQNGSVYPSREALAQVLRDGDEKPPRRSVVERRAPLPPVADFLRDVEAHAKSLAARLRIPEETLDFTVESLDPINARTVKLSYAKATKPEVLTPLLAYVGLVMIRATGGHWTTLYPRNRYLAREQPDGTTQREWVTTVDEDDEPTILTPDGRLFMPLSIVTTELARGEGGSLRRGVGGILLTDHPGGVGWGHMKVP